MSAPVDLAKLAADAKHWPVGWSPIINGDGEWIGSFTDDRGGEIETEPQSGYSAQLGQVIADSVNALPVLVEVARAALAMEAANTAYDDAGISGDLMRIKAALVDRAAVQAVYMSTLAKVSP